MHPARSGSEAAEPVLEDPVNVNQITAKDLREPNPWDIWRGGDRLSRLLIDMAARDMTACRIRVLTDRTYMTLTGRDGVQVPGPDFLAEDVLGPDWLATDVFGALLYLRTEIFRLANREPEYASPGETRMVDRRSGLLPPGMAGLRCTCDLRPPPDMSLDLQVLTEDEARSEAPSEDVS